MNSTIIKTIKCLFIVFIGISIIMTSYDSSIYAARVTDQNKVSSNRQKPPTRRRNTQRPQQKPDEAERFVTIDFNDVDIEVFIKFISELTHKNFIVDRRVKGKVSIISPSKISVKEAFKVFESVLEVHGFALVESGEVTKIVPATDARTKSIETRLREEASEPEDKVITQIIRLQYAEPNEIKKLFSPLISKSSVILSYPPTNMLIVTDVLSNIQRLLHLLSAIDVEGVGQELSMIPLEHATSQTLVKTLNSIFSKKSSKRKRVASEPVKIVAEERTNSVIVLASEDDMLKVKELITMLDKEVPREEGKIRVYYLEHAKAEDLEKVLKNLPSKQKKDNKGRAPIISKDVTIAADKSTNSLIITAERDDYLVLETVIKKLDIPRSMVYIECVIMEVSTDKALDLGLEWRGGAEFGTNKGGVFGGFGTGIPVTSLDSVTQFSNATVGVIGESIKFGGQNFNSISALVNATKTDDDVNIISTPQILTTDNEEATFKVGETIPFVTRSGSSDSSYDYNNYEYRDVGVSLKVTPQINKSGFVRLEIEQEVKDVVEDSVAANVLAPKTTNRSSKTTVLVQNEQTIVISGMIDEKVTVAKSGIPCLGKLPIIGRLFSSYNNKHEKTNLFFFLTPHIINNKHESFKFHDHKRKEIDSSMKKEEQTIKLYKKSIKD
ncbi:MAG: general secretion pathway protein D [Candidatus Magnetoglobus multicellularis str. Araruama]|uniref:General secretion pathway protein D n=1 Tax=Candidatus Magnetoglobus multicellularis str. Araruama TaxID=890399 RepID=A0A1V1PFM4_9BACT|nr:MAG: general secretion pathway protein D [Candidatus Magnetoglobus multicellularis str. Araruama]